MRPNGSETKEVAGERDVAGLRVFLTTFLALAGIAVSATGAFAKSPDFTFTPEPDNGPPPTGYLSGPCGLAVDSGGRFYVADAYHRTINLFNSSTDYIAQAGTSSLPGVPCYLAVAVNGTLYAASYHGAVRSYEPSGYPPTSFPETTYTEGDVIDPGPVTGIAVDPATEELYLNRRDHIAVYDSTGTHLQDIGAGSLSDSYGLAVSGAPATDGYLYVAEASDKTVKAFDPDATDPDTPVGVIDGTDTPEESFTSLHDAAIAVDDSGGEIYLTDNLEPEDKEQPEAIVWAFNSAGTYLGHLADMVVSGSPSGLSVDNSAGASQGRVYVTSGNTHEAGIYAYPSDPATQAAPEEPEIPPEPVSGTDPFPTVPVGGPEGQGEGILCEGDSCQRLPPDPEQVTLTTLLEGLGNPPIRYVRAPTDCTPHLRASRKLIQRFKKARRLARRTLRAGARGRAVKLARLSKRLRAGAVKQRRALSACIRANRIGEREGAGEASGAAAKSAGASPEPSRADTPSKASATVPGSGAETASLQATDLPDPIPAGFEARLIADGGGAAIRAGTRPYRLSLSLAPDGPGELESARFALPAGLLLNPSTVRTCADSDFATPRSSPLGTYSSGESCPGISQVGTVAVDSSLGERSFGLFMLEAKEGSAFRIGASPFGYPLVFEAGILTGDPRSRGTVLDAGSIPDDLGLDGLSVDLWGIPFDASHNTRRGKCLNESESAFALGKCSVGEPEDVRPLAFLTLPAECGQELRYRTTFATSSGRGSEAVSGPAVEDCASLDFDSFDMQAEGVLSTQNASTPAGYVFRLQNSDPNLVRPRSRIRSQIKRATVRLPDGVTLNPALGSGLKTCSESDLSRESASNPPGAGCPNASKIGDFRLRLPYFQDFLEGGVYLAEPDDPDRPGSENRFDSLVAIYLIAKSKERGLLIKAPGVLRPDPGDGTLTAVFDRLPRLPYTDLEVSFRAGQRSALVSPAACGDSDTRITLSPWAQGVDEADYTSATQITSGIGGRECPTGKRPFSPEVRAGGVNSNIGSYTPFHVALSRKDTEQQITSYSLSLPKGITAKLAGIPFCSEAAIKKARSNSGREELRDPACPSASKVGTTISGYGVGSAPAYARGSIYLAGPTDGRPLSLVTVNSAVVGPFDLGTIVIRSAFSLDPRTAKLEIDSSASDPIPHILKGVPLHLKDIRIRVDRENFTRNPTSCEASELVSTLTGAGERLGDPADDSTARAKEHFQLLNCLELGFRPELGLNLRGGVSRSAHPSLRATFRSRGDTDANLKDITVTMPRSLFLAQNHIRGICTRPQFAREACPADSVYGYARGITPLFSEPLTGPVYLRSSDNPLPDLVASLRSGSVRIILEGRIGPSQSGGIRTSFFDLPDAPLSSFALHLLGGKRGLLVNSENICKAPPRANVRALGQNNRGAVFSTRLRGQCGRYLARKQKLERLERLKERRRARQRARQRAKDRARRGQRR